MPPGHEKSTDVAIYISKWHEF